MRSDGFDDVMMIVGDEMKRRMIVGDEKRIAEGWNQT